jgi:hypothetical protein
MNDVGQLSGGIGNRGRVVRVGDTVRRPPGTHSVAVPALLGHLAASDVEGAAAVLGQHSEGRDMYEWIDGDVAVRPFPDGRSLTRRS